MSWYPGLTLYSNKGIHNTSSQIRTGPTTTCLEFDPSRTQLDAEAFCSRSDNNLGIASDTDLQAYHEAGESIVAPIALRYEQQQLFMMTPSTNEFHSELSRLQPSPGTSYYTAFIEPDPSFIHLTPKQTHRRIVRDIPQTIAFHALKFRRSQRAFILPLSTVSEADRTLLLFVALHLHFKPEAPQRRLCIDPSNTKGTHRHDHRKHLGVSQASQPIGRTKVNLHPIATPARQLQ